jgi:hypothetical protein
MKNWLILALLLCARLTCAQSQISGGQISGGTISFNNGGPPNYSGGCANNTQTIPVPTSAPFSQLANSSGYGTGGYGTVVNDPEPGSGYPCFHNLMIRASDASFYQFPNASPASKANFSIFGDTTTSGNSDLWGIQNGNIYPFMVGDQGTTYYLLTLNAATNVVTKVCSNYQQAMGLWTVPAFSRTTFEKIYDMANSGGTADGSVLYSENVSGVCPYSTSSVYDFSSSSNGLTPGTWYTTDPINVNSTDTAFSTGFSTSGSQNTARKVCGYLVGSGVSCLDLGTSGAAPNITGDYGGTGAPVCQNCPGSTTRMGTFTVHNVRCSYTGAYCAIAQGTIDSSAITTCTAATGTNNTSCVVASTALFFVGALVGYKNTGNSSFNNDPGFTITSINSGTNTITGTETSTLTGTVTAGSLEFNYGQDPFLWQVGTTNIWTGCVANSGLCGGHFVVGDGYFINEPGILEFASKVLNNPSSETAFPANSYRTACGTIAAPLDQHGGWLNGNSTDTLPWFLTTTSNGSTPTYGFCDYDEVLGVYPPSAGSNAQNVIREAHTWGAGSAAGVTQGAVQITVGAVSQDGRWYYFTSPMVGGAGTCSLGDTSGNYPATGTCRGDIFIIPLK